MLESFTQDEPLRWYIPYIINSKTDSDIATFTQQRMSYFLPVSPSARVSFTTAPFSSDNVNFSAHVNVATSPLTNFCL